MYSCDRALRRVDTRAFRVDCVRAAQDTGGRKKKPTSNIIFISILLYSFGRRFRKPYRSVGNARRVVGARYAYGVV